MLVKPATNIFIYPCTIVGYVRLTLVGGALAWYSLLPKFANELWVQLTFVLLIGGSLLLDILDGHLARKFNHVSKFGTLFDLLLDLITHTIIWTISGLVFAIVLIVLEWTGGLLIAAFSMQPDSAWKTRLAKSGEGLLKHYFSNNQRNFLSTYGNFCHFIFPITLYLGITNRWLYALSLPGVILYETVTVYLIIVLAKVLAYQESSQDK